MGLPIAFLFSGQGSQYPGMARELSDRDAEFRHELVRLDHYARSLIGTSVLDAFGLESTSLSSHPLRLTHPAIYMVEVALARRLMRAGIRPTCVVGASLGEMAASVAAGVLEARDGLRIVIRHAMAIERKCPPGGMLAVLHDTALRTQEPALFANTWLAADNFRRHFVVAGARDVLERLERELRQRSIVCQRVAVDYAFHSPLVNSAESDFLDCARTVVWRRPGCRLFSCAAAGEVQDITPTLAVGTTTKPIEFARTIEQLERHGPFRYVDLGPSGTLATLLKYLLSSRSGSSVHAILSARTGEKDAFDQLVHSLAPTSRAPGAPARQLDAT